MHTSTPTLCIFANFFIDNEERLQRMKDSFYSFRDIEPEEWKINIRGRLKHDASDFLYSELGEKVDLYFLESPRGWFHDSYSYMKDVTSDYVFFWIEDHICLVDPEYLRGVVNDMSILAADQLRYSFYHSSTLRLFSCLPVLDSLQFITGYKVDKGSVRTARQLLGRDFYTVSAVSVFKSKFFLDVLTSKRPYLKRWSKYLPFDFEKKAMDFVAPLIICALPNKELFAAIDDDHSNPGYSLMARGQYPNRLSRENMKDLEYGVRRSPRISRLMPRFMYSFLASAYGLLRRLYYTLSYYF